MAVSKEYLNDIISKLPEDKLELLKKYAEQLLYTEDQKDSFEKAFEYTVKNYDKALKGLVDR